MNIFILHWCVRKCAALYSDPHLIKIILEIAQLLCTAHYNNDGDKPFEEAYRKTHSGHPWALWVGESSSNYNWACKMALALCDEYNYRYKKGEVQHKCRRLIEQLRDQPPKTWRTFDEARNPPTDRPSKRRRLPDVTRIKAVEEGLTDMPLCTGGVTVAKEDRVNIVSAYRAYYRSPQKAHTLRYNQELRRAPNWNTLTR